MNHLPIYILALIVLGIIIWHKVNKWLNGHEKEVRIMDLEMEYESEPRDMCGRFTSEEPQMELKRIYESRRGKVSFK